MVLSINPILQDYNEEVDVSSEDYFNFHTESSVNSMINRNITMAQGQDSIKWEGSLFITSEVLFKAPEDYFDVHQKIVPIIVQKVQAKIAEANTSTIISEALSEPENPVLLNNAFREVQRYLPDILNTFSLSALDLKIVNKLVTDEIIGLSVLDPLYRDNRINEIIANGPFDIQVQIDGLLYRVPSCKFRNQEHLEAFLEKLFAPLGKKVSRMTPQVKGRIHDFSRVYACDRSIAPTGPTLNIRRHKEQYVHPRQYLVWKSAPKELLTDLGNMVYNGACVLVLGGTGSGKTTLLSSLTGFIRDDARVMTLEDNLEMKPCPKKMLAPALECLEARKEIKGDTGVTMRDLVKGSLQMKPDWIIVGEVTDGAAYDMIQALATGHSGGSTVHADSAEDGIGRLVSMVSQGGVMQGSHEAMPLIAAAIDFIVTVENYPVDGSRRITAVSEVAPQPSRNSEGELVLKLNKLWQFVDEGVDDKGRVIGHWEKVGEISDFTFKKLHLALAEKKSWEELCNLADVNVPPEIRNSPFEVEQ